MGPGIQMVNGALSVAVVIQEGMLHQIHKGKGTGYFLSNQKVACPLFPISLEKLRPRIFS